MQSKNEAVCTQRENPFSLHFFWHTRRALQQDLIQARQALAEMNEEIRHLHEQLAESCRESQCHALKAQHNADALTKTETILSAMQQNIPELAAGEYSRVYEKIQPQLDPDGFCLYQEAKRYTGVNVSYAFPTEDNMGYFEDLNGLALLNWLEVAAYGECDWEMLPGGGGYECAINRRVKWDTEEYQLYRKTVCEKAVRELLKMEPKI